MVYRSALSVPSTIQARRGCPSAGIPATTVDRGSQTVNCLGPKPWTIDGRPWTVDCRLWAVDRRPLEVTPILNSVKTVAVIGASADRRKFGNKALRAFRQAGYRAIPITPNHAEVEGERAYATVVDYPGVIDMATVYVPPATGARLIDGLAEKGIAEVWFNPGAESPELIERARALGLRTIQACSVIGIGLNPSQF
jgi:predicted CoA-binding protein